MSCSSSSMTSASGNSAATAGRSGRRTSTGSRRPACDTTTSTRRRSARRRRMAALLTGGGTTTPSGMAALPAAATGYPGNFGSLPRSAATIAETLKQNGYNTMAMGKWHLAPYTAYTSAGPFDRWPLGMGFEKYYGFLGGETDQWAPLLVQDNHFIDTPKRPGYHLTEDLVDRTIASIRDQQQANTARPFFAYLALGACHAPLHAPKPFIDKYKGKFDQGWDKVRESKDVRAAEGPRDHPEGRGVTAGQPRHPALGRPERTSEAGVLPASGGLRRLPRPRRSQPGPVVRRPRRPGHSRQYADHGRLRQRGLAGRAARRHAEHRPVSELLPGHGRGDAGEARRGRRPVHRSALPDGLVDGRKFTAEAVEAGYALGRQYRPVHRLLAREDQGRRRDPQPVSPHRRCRPDDPRSGRPACAGLRPSTASGRCRYTA